MGWWKLWGMNPTYKEFIEKHPDATMIGMCWALYWRLAVLIIAAEIILFIVFGGFGAIFGSMAPTTGTL